MLTEAAYALVEYAFYDVDKVALVAYLAIAVYLLA